MDKELDVLTEGGVDEALARVERLKPETAEAIYDLVKEAPEQQIGSGGSLDTKMVQIFAGASVVMGFLGLSSSTSPAGGRWWIVALLIGALASYAFTAFMAFRHLAPREYWRNLEATRWLSPEYQDLSEDEFRRVAIVDTAKAYKHNNEILEEKVHYMRRALVSAALEITLVAVVLILYRLL